MLLSLALIFLSGIALGTLCKKLHLPRLLGMLAAGIILGPYVLNILDSSVLNISSELRRIALLLILTRAGLNLDLPVLKKVGRPALLMCFVPACLEILGCIFLSPLFLPVSILEAAILGTVLAAVSPAVVVPKMLNLMDKGYGTKQGIPQMILAGASADDVFVIVLFTIFSDLAVNNQFSAWELIRIPASILLGIGIGIICGWVLAGVFCHVHFRDSIKVVILLSVSFLLVTLEDNMTGVIGFSGLLATISMGITLNIKSKTAAKRISQKYDRLWSGAELLLFVLVGAAVPIGYALDYGIAAIIFLLCVLLFRIGGVWLCTLKTQFTLKERLFASLAYIPKATVQAAIGPLPLAMGLACGSLVLTVAVLAIIITAPLGAFLIDMTYKHLLEKNTETQTNP